MGGEAVGLARYSLKDSDMNAMTYETIRDARREQMLRELSSDLADLVASGDLTDAQANQWYSDKADQWANGIG